MGCYDSLWVDCPNCGNQLEFQSKSGDCRLADYTLTNIPSNVLMDINRHSPIVCAGCNRLYKIDYKPTLVEVS